MEYDGFRNPASGQKVVDQGQADLAVEDGGVGGLGMGRLQDRRGHLRPPLLEEPSDLSGLGGLADGVSVGMGGRRAGRDVVSEEPCNAWKVRNQ